MRASLKESFGVLTADRNKLEAIFDGLTDAVIVVDDEGPLRFSNSAAAQLLDPAGQPPEAVLPQLQRAAEIGFAAHPALRIGDRAYSMHGARPARRARRAGRRSATAPTRCAASSPKPTSSPTPPTSCATRWPGSRARSRSSRAAPRTTPQARDHFLDRLADDAERMSRLTQALLTLARVESLGAGETEVVDVPVAIRDVVEAVEAPPGTSS